MAKVPYGVETLPKVSIVWVGRTNVTDNRRQTDRRQTDNRRQTDGRRHIANLNLSLRSLIKLWRFLHISYNKHVNQLATAFISVHPITVNSCSIVNIISSMQSWITDKSCACSWTRWQTRFIFCSFASRILQYTITHQMKHLTNNYFHAYFSSFLLTYSHQQISKLYTTFLSIKPECSTCHISRQRDLKTRRVLMPAQAQVTAYTS